MATVTELSIPHQIRTKSEQARGYRDHARQLRRDYDSGVQERESNHQKLIASGEGPCDSAEVLRLQKSRWQVLTDHEKSLNALVAELTETKNHLDSEHKLCVALIEDYRADEIRKLVEDFGYRESDAKNRVDFSEPLAQVKRETHKIHELSEDILKMINAANNEIEAITAKKSQLSRQWRTF